MKTKTAFRRLNLQIVFRAVEAEPRPYYTVTSQCDFVALAGSYVLQRFGRAAVDQTRVRLAPAKSWFARQTTTSVAGAKELCRDASLPAQHGSGIRGGGPACRHDAGRERHRD
jgi:hypothetical protein